MKFYGFRSSRWDHELISNQVDEIKEHVEIIFNYIKDFIDNKGNGITIEDDNSPFVFCNLELYGNEMTGAGPQTFYIKPMIVLRLLPTPEDHSDYVNQRRLFDNEISPLFEQYVIKTYLNYDDKLPDERLQFGDMIEI
jgi:hypothetical protein